jgi:hypothetical protein
MRLEIAAFAGQARNRNDATFCVYMNIYSRRHTLRRPVFEGFLCRLFFNGVLACVRDPPPEFRRCRRKYTARFYGFPKGFHLPSGCEIKIMMFI